MKSKSLPALGLIALGSATIHVPPGGTWSFETTTVNDTGVDYAAFPSLSVSN